MYTRRPQKPKKRWGRYVFLTLLLAAVGGYIGWALLRPLSPLQPEDITTQLQIDTPPSQLAWPRTGQASVGIVGEQGFDFNGTQGSAATASTIKLLTALVVLDKHPLQPGETGPSVMMTAADEKRYQDYLTKNGSVVPVKAGTALTQKQMLEAVMLPSANNIADSMAIWAFGSMSDYQNAAVAYLRKHNLNQTKVGSDASGLAPNTTSTASDLVEMAKLAMQNPTLAGIASTSEVPNFPVAGTIRTTNTLLGGDGIVGLKTGNSDQAGGAFIGAAKITVSGHNKTIVTAVLSSPSKPQAMADSQALIRSAASNFTPITSVKKDQVVGRYTIPWGGTVAAIASGDLQDIAWRGQPQVVSTKLDPVAVTAAQGDAVGKISSSDATIPAQLAQKIPKPSLKWRLMHPIDTSL